MILKGNPEFTCLQSSPLYQSAQFAPRASRGTFLHGYSTHPLEKVKVS